MSIAPFESQESSEAQGAEFEELDPDEPTTVPKLTWVSLIGFAVFLIGFGTCAANWMFK